MAGDFDAPIDEDDDVAQDEEDDPEFIDASLSSTLTGSHKMVKSL